jgi:hypothetical protein
VPRPFPRRRRCAVLGRAPNYLPALPLRAGALRSDFSCARRTVSFFAMALPHADEVTRDGLPLVENGRLPPAVVSMRRRVDERGSDARALGRHPDRPGKHPDASGKHLDRSGKHPDASGKHPDASGKHLDASGKHLDASGKHLDRSGKHPDASGKHLDRSGKHPDDGGFGRGLCWRSPCLLGCISAWMLAPPSRRRSACASTPNARISLAAFARARRRRPGTHTCSEGAFAAPVARHQARSARTTPASGGTVMVNEYGRFIHGISSATSCRSLLPMSLPP